MSSEPSTAAFGGGLRASGPERPRALSLQLLVGSYFFIVAAVLILPGLFLADRALRRRLQDTRLTTHQATMREVVRGVERRTAAAEERVTRYAWLLSREPSGSDPAEVRAFDRFVVRDPDGAWRPRKELFDPAHEAGVHLPKTVVVDPAFKSFLMRGKRLTERFGAGALDPELVDAWITPAAGGIVMYVPDQPGFPWELSATEDWSGTDWMRFADPSVNPTGVPRWTDPFHSEKTDAWFVSVVAPFRRGSSWGGSVGQDLSWQELVDYSARAPLEAGGRFLLVGRNGGVILADSNTVRDPTRPDGRRLNDLPDVEVRDTLVRLLASSSGGGTPEPQLVRTSDSYLLWSSIPATGWLVASLIPQSSIDGPINGPLRAIRWAVLLGLVALSVASLASIHLEIRRRQAIEAETRRAKDRFQSLFQLDPDGVALTTQSGEVLEVNDSAVALTGYTREEMMGRSVLSLGLWDDPAQRERVLEIVQRQGVCRSVPVIMRRKDGRKVEIELSGRLIEVDGKPCLVSILRDVEEQRALERQLTQAQKMEAIGRLAGGVAHDFNNIMTAVMGYAQIASESLPPDSPAVEDLAEILRAARRASELTHQLLAFARRQVTLPQPVDLNSLVEETRKLLERLLGEDVVLLTELAQDLPAVLVDPGQMEQVLVNLSVNARDAMPRGGPLLLKTGRRNGEVLLDVVDTGVGILPEHQPHIFEPFFTTKEHGKGTGLGLATCYGIVRQAGGHIEVSSDPGTGSRFRVVLPALPDGTVPIHMPAEGTRIDGGMPRGNERVLLAEDEPQVRDLALRLLRGLGYTVLVAETGASALEVAAASSEPIDLLVTDVVMPGMTGEELAARLRSVRPDVKVLYISGYAEDSEAIEQALRQGDSFLGKPFTAAQLARRVRAILEQPGGVRGSGEGAR